MSPEFLKLALVFLAGGLVGGLAVWGLTVRAATRRGLRDAQRLSAAEATSDGERARREELERELEEARGGLRELDRQLAVGQERLAAAQRLLEEQRGFVETASRELQGAFRELAGEALRGSSEQFLQLAEQRLAAARVRASADLDERRQAIEGLLEPLRESLGQLDRRAQEMERSRVEAYSRIDEQVQMLAGAASRLGERTTALTAALKGARVRGRWGELALRNVAELAGMTAHCDFEEQSAAGDGARPDMTVRLPGGRYIAVDAKAPLTAFLEAAEATEEPVRSAALKRHVRDLRRHIASLSSRDYAAALGSGVDLVVMFLPADSFLAAAFARAPDLQVEALRSRVLLATPTTLIALLRTVAIYWQQRSLAENAEAIAEAARTLYERAAKVGEELAAVGRGLRGAVEAYNRAVGSFQRRLMPAGRKLEELKVPELSRRRLTDPGTVEVEPRSTES